MLQWEVYGRKPGMSLGSGATRAFAKRMAVEKEKELNSDSPTDPLSRLSWSDFQKNLTTFCPGYDLPAAQRKEAADEGRHAADSVREEATRSEQGKKVVSRH